MVTLKSRGSAILGLVPVFNCSWDSSQQFLATEVSSFSVHPFGNARSEPLFRVEYVRSQNQDLPSSHIHVHAHRDEFTHLLGFAAKLDAENSRQVKRYLSGTTTLSRSWECQRQMVGNVPPRIRPKSCGVERGYTKRLFTPRHLAAHFVAHLVAL